MRIQMFSLDERDGRWIDIPDRFRHYSMPVLDEVEPKWVHPRTTQVEAGDTIKTKPNPAYEPPQDATFRVEHWVVEKFVGADGVVRKVLVQPELMDAYRRAGLA